MKWLGVLGAALLGSLVAFAASAGPDAPGMVPLTGALGTHDPTIIKAGNTYVRLATGRGIPLAVSADLKVWTDAGAVFTQNPEWTREQIVGSTDFWAPDVVLRGGEWRMYYAVSTFGSNLSAIGLAVNPSFDPTRPSEGWIDRGPVFQSERGDDYNAIDPQVVADGGSDFLVFGSFWGGIKMVLLNAAGTGTADDTIVDLARRPEAPDAIEGAYVLKHDGRYYLFVSFDFCCRGLRSTYNIRVGRSDHLEGPYADRDGKLMLAGGGTILKTSDARDIGPGHNSILVDGDREYLVYHTYDARYGGLSRLRIQELGWENGWPVAPN